MNVDDFKKDLADLLKKHDVTIGVDIQGDDCNLGESFVVIDSKDKEYTLKPYDRYIDASDLT